MVSVGRALPDSMPLGSTLLLGFKFCESDLVNNYFLICGSEEKKSFPHSQTDVTVLSSNGIIFACGKMS